MIGRVVVIAATSYCRTAAEAAVGMFVILPPIATFNPVDSTSGSAAPRTTCAPVSPVGAATALRLPATSLQPPPALYAVIEPDAIVDEPPFVEGEPPAPKLTVILVLK